MEKKNYVYKVCASGYVCDTLKSAVSAAYDEMLYQAERVRIGAFNSDGYYGSFKVTLSTPVVYKVRGGYKVKAISSCGTVMSRRIDVFEPYSANKDGYHDFEILRNPKKLW